MRMRRGSLRVAAFALAFAVAFALAHAFALIIEVNGSTRSQRPQRRGLSRRIARRSPSSRGYCSIRAVSPLWPFRTLRALRSLVFARTAVTCSLAFNFAGCGPALIWSGRTPDRQHRVEVIEDGGLQYVAIDGERRAAYHGIAGHSIALSPGHLAFAARLGAHWTVVYDGKPSDSWDAIGALVMTRSGELAYAAERDRGWYVVIDGHPGPRFDAIVAGTLQVGHDAAGFAYVGESAGRVTAVIGGKQGPTFDGIGQLVLDGGHHAYAARRALEAYVIVDGVTGPPWSAVSKLALANGHVAYAASDGTDWRVIVDGEPGPTVDRVSEIVLSKDGAHHAWIASVAAQDVLALDDVPIIAAPKLRARGVVFSPRASSLAYVEPALPRGERVVVVGPTVDNGTHRTEHTEGAVFDEVGTPTFSPDGQRLAYAAVRGKTWLMIVDGVEHAGGTHVGDPVFSADSRHVAYVARRGNRSVAVIDDREHRFDLAFEDSIVFSADAKRWAVVAGDLERERMFISVDGRTEIPLRTVDIYSAATQSPITLGPPKDNVLRRWAQAEVDRSR
ncbi:MAG: hypothetical protein JWO36_232 [Myxococcales bacterium]|nr:hypothetical protein [Myxococcales bacterium]